MWRSGILLLLLSASLHAWDGSAAEFAAHMRAAGLDTNECYQVRNLVFTKEDIRFYLTEGFLIFGKPVDGRRRSAVFAAEVEAGDAEVLVFPPTRSERLSLARSAGSPNLSEHFKLAVMIFSDDTYEMLSRQIQEAGEPRRSPERGVLLEESWAGLVRNLTSSFETRLVHDALAADGAAGGFFHAAVSGANLGNFDLVYDPLAAQQISIGRVSNGASGFTFDIWTSFAARSFRNAVRSVPGDAFRLSNYRLDATLQPDLGLSVTTRVVLTPTRAGVRVLVFNLSPRMRLISAAINGAPAEFFQRDAMRENLIRGTDAVFLLLPGSPMEPGKRYEVEFRNEGHIVQDTGNKVYFVGARDNWYPKLPIQFSQYDVTFRYPSDLNLVVAGELVEEAAGEGWRTTRHRIATPVGFLGFNLGVYQHIAQTRGPYSVEVFANKQLEPRIQELPGATGVLPPRRVYDPITRRSIVVPGSVMIPMPVLPPDPAERLQELASEISAAFEFMASRFGPPPIRNLTVAPIPGNFGQGFPGLLYLPTLSYIRLQQGPGLPANPNRQAVPEILLAHEVAHQWWGNVVAPASNQDTWLMEALANYSALLFLEKRKGTKVLDSILADYSRNLRSTAAEGRTIDSTGPIAWGPRLISSQAPSAWRVITYEKGSWIMHMLRRRLGDERFLSMLAEIVKRYRQSTLTTEQFRALAVKFQPSGSPDPKLETFFENWVYSTGIPTLQLRHSVRGKASAYTLTGSLTQSGVDADFSAWVPVEVQFKTGKPLVHWVRTDSDPAGFTVALKQAPVRVLLDPSSSVLSVR